MRFFKIIHRALFVTLIIYSGSSQAQKLQYNPVFSEGSSSSNIKRNLKITSNKYGWMFDSCKFDLHSMINANLERQYGNVDLSDASKVESFFLPFFLYCNRRIIPYLNGIRFDDTGYKDLEKNILLLSNECGYYRSEIYIKLLFSLYTIGIENVIKSKNFSCGNFSQSNCHVAAIDSLFNMQAIPYSKSGDVKYIGPNFDQKESNIAENEEDTIDYERLGISKAVRDTCKGVGAWKDG